MAADRRAFCSAKTRCASATSRSSSPRRRAAGGRTGRGSAGPGRRPAAGRAPSPSDSPHANHSLPRRDLGGEVVAVEEDLEQPRVGNDADQRLLRRKLLQGDADLRGVRGVEEAGDAVAGAQRFEHRPGGQERHGAAGVPALAVAGLEAREEPVAAEDPGDVRRGRGDDARQPRLRAGEGGEVRVAVARREAVGLRGFVRGRGGSRVRVATSDLSDGSSIELHPVRGSVTYSARLRDAILGAS